MKDLIVFSGLLNVLMIVALFFYVKLLHDINDRRLKILEKEVVFLVKHCFDEKMKRVEESRREVDE